MSVFFTSDTHFNHRNIAGPSVSSWGKGYRVFNSVSEMNETIIKNWNAKVSSIDEVYHLGDFAFGSVADTITIRRRLNGRIYLIKGNHEGPATAAQMQVPRLFEWIKDVISVKVDGQRFWLSHYAHKVWDKSHHGIWHLYGHSHGSLPDDPNSMSFDCGVDCHEYSPLSLDDVKLLMSMKTFTPIDHHEA